MSRHEFAVCRSGAKFVAIGWDRPLATFFVTALGTPDSHGDQAVLEWVGTGHREISSPAEAVRIASRYADLPADLVARLEVDRLKTGATLDGPAQRNAPRLG